MEKKTIGSFIATLRRANGMTQKDLAERLHVSDKTVSRWEREEGTPDLALIPVIAEVFGVTCDELLRGERNAPSQSKEMQPVTIKGEKAAQHLLKATYSKYQIHSMIASGLAVAGVIAALVANTFQRAQLGFLITCAFGCVAGIWQYVALNRGLLSISTEDMPGEVVQPVRLRMIVMTSRVVGLITVAVLAGLPMLLFVPGSYYGVSAGPLAVMMALMAGIAWLAWSFVHPTLLCSLHRRGIIVLPDQEAQRLLENRRLKAKLAGVLALILAVTGAVQCSLTNAWGAHRIAEPMVFEDYASFVTFMEMETYGRSYEQVVSPVGVMREDVKTQLKLADGTVVAEYAERNGNVIGIVYQEKDGSLLPISVTTRQAMEVAQRKVALRNGVFYALYGMEMLAIVALYLKKRKR